VQTRGLDKIAASKRKGMWMGGNVPLGYEVKDRKLILNEPEASTVRKGAALEIDEEIRRVAHVVGA
jgi:hypothetical protein